VERSIRACNVILYNVGKDPHVQDVKIANDILKVIDTSLAVSPENVVRLGKGGGRKPAPLKLRLENSDSARSYLRKQSVLLGKDVYAKIVIREDKTPRQMQYLKSLRTVGRMAYFAGQNSKSECIALKIYTVRFSGSLIKNLISDLSNSKWRTQNGRCILKKNKLL
jgi:hypothetical protein